MSYPPTSGVGTDARLTALWLARFASAHTRASYARDVRACLACAARAAGAPVALAGLTVADLMAWRAQRCAMGQAPATVNRGLAAVKSLLAFAHRTGYLSRNIGRAVGALPVPCRLAERILDEADVQRLLQAGGSRRDRLFLHFLYYAGCRVTEATGLCWRDLAGLKAKDAARPVVAGLHGKGGRTRHVPLPAFLGQVLRAWRRGARRTADAPVFATRTGRRLDRKQAWQIVRAAARRAGLAQPVSPHWLRHAHASHAAVAWQRQGRACAVLDLDPQASACAWGDRRPGARPAVWPVLPARLARDLDAAQRHAPPLWAVVLDTPGSVETPALAAARAAQVCAITCRPTMLDLLALEQTLDVCRLAGAAAPVVILTQCPARGPQTREAAAVVTGRSLPLAPSLGARVAFAHAVTEAQGVTEYQPASRAAREIDALAHWLAHVLEDRHGQN